MASMDKIAFLQRICKISLKDGDVHLLREGLEVLGEAIFSLVLVQKYFNTPHVC